jgi:hypothetical protein
MLKKILVFLIVLISADTFAQDFGFGFDDETNSASGSVSVKANGEISAEFAPYIHDFLENSDIMEISLSNVKINLTLTSPYIDVFTFYNFNAASISELWEGNEKLKKTNYTPLVIDEAFFRVYIGPVNIETGYRKLSWGKADGGGPLDVTNPIDYSDLRKITDLKAIKIARPMLHITWNTGSFSKLEGVFIPNFAGHRFAEAGRWQPSQSKNMPSIVEKEITSMATKKFAPMMAPILQLNPSYAQMFDNIKNNMASSLNRIPITYPSTDTFKYFQAGLRYTTTIGSVDIGGQYFYGNLFRPSFTIAGIDPFLDDLAGGIFRNFPLTLNLFYQGHPEWISPQIKYTRYHQIGIDYAQVLFSLNVRAEAALHLTEDIKGDDGSLQNSFIGWSFGFDRDLFLGINLNLQCNETIRLFNDKIGDNPILDAEAGTKAISTRLTMQLSKKFLKDNLETKATAIWDIENSDFYIIPAIVYTIGSLTTELSAGFFTGKEDGDLGQYRNNSYIKVGLKYSF